MADITVSPMNSWTVIELPDSYARSWRINLTYHCLPEPSGPPAKTWKMGTIWAETTEHAQESYWQPSIDKTFATKISIPLIVFTIQDIVYAREDFEWDRKLWEGTKLGIPRAPPSLSRTIPHRRRTNRMLLSNNWAFASQSLHTWTNTKVFQVEFVPNWNTRQP